MAKFKAGRSGNPSGRPRGAKNKTPVALREWLSQIIDSNRNQLEADLLKLDPKDRWSTIEKLIGYAIPRLASTQSNVKLENLSEGQIDDVVATLLNELKE